MVANIIKWQPLAGNRMRELFRFGVERGTNEATSPTKRIEDHTVVVNCIFKNILYIEPVLNTNCGELTNEERQRRKNNAHDNVRTTPPA